MTITGSIITFSGIIVTIVIGVWGVRYASKLNIKTQLLFIEHDCISLFRSIVKEIDDIEIKYKDKVIDENLIIFKGTFFNSGNSDIDKTIIHKPLLIKLPEDYIWTKAKIIDKSNDIAIKESIDNNQLIFKWDILKENEYFTFDSIIEYKQSSDKDDISDDFNITRNLSRNIRFNHRITNLKSIKKQHPTSKPMHYRVLLYIILCSLSIAGGCLYLATGQFVSPNYDLQFKLQRDNTIYYAKLNAVDKDKIELINERMEKFTLTNKELGQLLSKDFKIVKQNIKYVRLYVGSLAVVGMLFFTISLTLSEINRRQLYEKTKIITDKHSNIMGEGIGLGIESTYY
jgi:hypothetical protein